MQALIKLLKHSTPLKVHFRVRNKIFCQPVFSKLFHENISQQTVMHDEYFPLKLRYSINIDGLKLPGV